MVRNEGKVVTFRCQVELRGPLAEKILRIVEREGNSAAAVCRRLVSVGLRHEPEENE